MSYTDFASMSTTDIVIYFVISLLITAIVYLAYPIFLIIKKTEMSERKTRKIAIWNSTVGFIIFTILNGTAKVPVSVTWYFIASATLKKFCSAKTEEAKLRSSYGKLYEHLLADSIGIYMIKKGLNSQEIDKEMANQLQNEWLKKCGYEKGKRYVKKLNSFIEEANWKTFAKEINLNERIERGEFNPNRQQPMNIENNNLNTPKETTTDVVISEPSITYSKTQNHKVRYCSKCGDVVVPNTLICTGCGKKYFNVKKVLKISGCIFGAFALLLIALNLGVYWGTEEQYQNYTKKYVEEAEYWENEYYDVLTEYNVYKTESQQKIEFYDEAIVFVIDGYGDYYYTYDQMQIITQGIGEYTYWAYNKELAIYKGYRAWK